ncbi:MAG: TfpX/TfpZ family type IV pilin accessory protein [Hydrogenophaga sp.]
MNATDFLIRAKAATIHFSLSILTAAVVAALVFLVWYPGEYRSLAGGTELLLLIMSVDIVLGPLLTFAVYNLKKSISHLRKDIGVIVLLQLGALAYGLYVVFLARPVVLVFEFDRFRVISSAEVLKTELPQALPQYRDLSITGPVVLALRKSEVGAERSNALATAIFEGVDTSQRPKFWIPYGAEERRVAIGLARPVDDLIKKYPEAAEAVTAIAPKLASDSLKIGFLPVRAKNEGVAILDPDGHLLGLLPFDGYF